MVINLYELLHINSNATKEQIKVAYLAAKRQTNDQKTQWLIDEAYILLMDDDKRNKYHSLILNTTYTPLVAKPKLSKNEDDIAPTVEKLPKLLKFILWLFSFECGAILLRLGSSTFLFAIHSEHNARNGLIILTSILGMIVTTVPVILGAYAVAKRYRIALTIFFIIAILHLSRNVISLLLMNTVVDSDRLIFLPIIALVLLTIAKFNKAVQNWLNEPARGQNFYKLLFVASGLIYMVIFAIGLADMRKQMTQAAPLTAAEMKFLGASDQYYYYLDLTTRVIPVANGYILPVVVTDVAQSQYQTTIIVDSKARTYCMQTANTNCNNQNSFQAYDLSSPINEAVQYVEHGDK